MPCPACGGNQKGESCFAVVSPYIRKLGTTNKRISRYQICGDCGTGFFTLRYSDPGMRRLYENYRGHRYTELRTKWEGWYSLEYNEAHTKVEWLDDRARIITDFLKGKVRLDQTSVVDVGGDTGEIASRLGAASYIIREYSNRAIQSAPIEVRKATSSLAILAHVLEHVSNPRNELQTLLQDFDALYVEVPRGVPAVSKFRKSKLALTWALIQSFSSLAWRNSSAPSAGRILPAKILRVSEHLTFFSLEGLEAMAQSLGAKVVLKETTVLAPDFRPVGVIQALFRKAPSTSK